jgi:catechol 2,3-dioxygenase-like lactoylglutathione lyase family enzyme
MRINLASVPVPDTAKALKFYTDVMGFVKKTEIAEINWITVASPEVPDQVELLLEPAVGENGFPPAITYQKALKDAGIPWTSFACDDVQKEYERMKALGVIFTKAPTRMGPVTIAVLDDTCGNLIQIAQQH